MPIRRLLHSAVEFVFPPVCAFCGDECAVADTGASGLCDSCRGRLWPTWVRQCGRCGAHVGPYIDTTSGCVHCRDDRFAFRRATSLGVYARELRLACRRMKRSGQEPLAAVLGRFLGEQVAEVFADSPPEVVLPVPQHWWSRAVRGHNPAETLGRAVARRLGVEFHPHLLVKTRRTPPQSRLSPTGRRGNLRDVFAVRGGKRLRGRRVLLVDDVLTTGTTANRIARLLRSADAETIMVAVVARGLGDVRDADPF